MVLIDWPAAELFILAGLKPLVVPPLQHHRFMVFVMLSLWITWLIWIYPRVIKPEVVLEPESILFLIGV